MGAAFRKVFREPLNIHDWDSVAGEAIRIYTSLDQFIREAQRSPLKSHKQRFDTINNQWWNLRCILQEHATNSETRLLWLNNMNTKIHKLNHKFYIINKVNLTTIDENSEPFLSDFS